jgi:photosystem II stability/assembly factor-like uncharacterized protein
MSADIFISTTGSGLTRATRCSAGQWEVESLLSGQEVPCLAADPLDRNVLYAGTQGNGVLRSDDQGATWRQAGMEGRIVKSLAASPTEPGTVYAGTKPSLVFVSRDGGCKWNELTAFRRIKSWFWFSPAEKPFTAYVQAIALSPSDPNVIMAGIEFGAVVRSADGGKTWMGHRNGALRDCHSLTFNSKDGNWVYEGGGTGGGAAFSRDGGASWAKHKSGLDRHYGWAVAGDPARPNIWYASLSPGPSKAHTDGKAEAYIFRSTNGGRWEKLGGGLPQPLAFMPYALVTDPDAPGHIYAGLSNGDVWHSTDHGDTWEQMPFNLRSIHRTLIML